MYFKIVVFRKCKVCNQAAMVVLSGSWQKCGDTFWIDTHHLILYINMLNFINFGFMLKGSDMFLENAFLSKTQWVHCFGEVKLIKDWCLPTLNLLLAVFMLAYQLVFKQTVKSTGSIFSIYPVLHSSIQKLVFKSLHEIYKHEKSL